MHDDVGLEGVQRLSHKDGPVQDELRRKRQQHLVFLAQGLTFGAVGDDYRSGTVDGLELPGGWETGATAADEAGPLDHGQERRSVFERVADEWKLAKARPVLFGTDRSSPRRLGEQSGVKTAARCCLLTIVISASNRRRRDPFSPGDRHRVHRAAPGAASNGGLVTPAVAMADIRRATANRRDPDSHGDGRHARTHGRRHPPNAQVVPSANGMGHCGGPREIGEPVDAFPGPETEPVPEKAGE